MKNNISKFLLVFLLFSITANNFAKTNQKLANPANPVEKRAQEESVLPPNYFAIAFYKPTYLLPYYYTGMTNTAVYQNNTPDDEKIKHAEIKYQISFKVPLWKEIMHRPSTLYLAYSQLSYWQAYNHTAFFRETNYEPELFLANELNYHMSQNFVINFINLGVEHQSNGKGGTLERSWNRAYLEAITSVGNLMISLKPWYVFHDGTMNANNPDIAQFLGYGRFLIAYKYHNQVISLTAHNLIESHARRATTELTWSFPLTKYMKGYIQVFSGYGQSLIEYNHRTNSAGVGISLSDWL